MQRFIAPHRVPSHRLLDKLCNLCRPALERGVAVTAADYRVKQHRSAGMALALVAYFLYGMGSLRQLERRLARRPGAAAGHRAGARQHRSSAQVAASQAQRPVVAPAAGPDRATARRPAPR